MWTKKNLMIIGGMLLLGLSALLGWYVFTRKKTHSLEERIINRCQKQGLSLEQAKTVVAISKHETGNFTSRLSKPPYNNLFGMHLPTTRKTTAVDGDEQGWAIFNTYEDSVDDFLLWFDMWGWKPQEDAVKTVTFMKAKNYFEDTLENYIKGVKSWL